MGAVPMLHADNKVRAAVRHGLRRTDMRVVTCHSAAQLERVVADEVVDAVVVDVRAAALGWALGLVVSYPRIPVFAYSAFRPEDGRLISACAVGGLRSLFVDGIDDPVAGEVLISRSAGRERRALLADAPERLRLAEPIQLDAWEEILGGQHAPVTSAEVARTLGVTREHLSREFAAGGAPNLKRVIDLTRVACAAHLLGNPGYTVSAVARILRFASPSHLATCSRRVAGVAPGALATLGIRGVLDEFLQGRTHSRL